MCGRCKRVMSGLETCTRQGTSRRDERGRKGTDGLVIYDILRAYAGSGS